MRLELTTPTLATWCSTTELHPLETRPPQPPRRVANLAIVPGDSSRGAPGVQACGLRRMTSLSPSRFAFHDRIGPGTGAATSAKVSRGFRSQRDDAPLHRRVGSWFRSRRTPGGAGRLAELSRGGRHEGE